MVLETASSSSVEYDWVQIYGAIAVITVLSTNYCIITINEEKWSKTFSNYPKVFWEYSEDNCGVLEFSGIPKLLLCTKYINFAYHYFHSYVIDKNFYLSNW